MNLMKLVLILTVTVCASVRAADDLKTYYEKQKAELAPTFKAPQLGSQVTVKTAAGQSRTGILMKLDAASISLMTETGNVSYKRLVLHESSRALFFAEDYAHVKALEMARLYKNDLHKENIAEQAAGIHEGRISVSAKSEKTSDKKVEKEERENKKSGEKRTTTTTTKTYTELQKLKISVANNATHSDSFTLKCIFFSQRISKGSVKKSEEGADSIPKTIKQQSDSVKKVSVDARGRTSIEISSEPFIVTKTEISTGSSYSSNREPVVSGEESAGWLALLMYDAQVMDKKASAKGYLSDEWVNKYK